MQADVPMSLVEKERTAYYQNQDENLRDLFRCTLVYHHNHQRSNNNTSKLLFTFTQPFVSDDNNNKITKKRDGEKKSRTEEQVIEENINYGQITFLKVRSDKDEKNQTKVVKRMEFTAMGLHLQLPLIPKIIVYG